MLQSHRKLIPKKNKGAAGARVRSTRQGPTGGDTFKNQQNHQDVVKGSAPVPAVKMGSNEVSFAAVVKRAYLYIGNVNPNVREQAVVDYIKNKYPEDEFTVEELSINEKAKTKSFKLTLDYALLDSLRKPEFWPQGIIVKRFFLQRRRRTETEN